MTYYENLFNKKLTGAQFNRLQNFIETTTGIKMPYSKKIMVESRLIKRLSLLKISDFSEYIELVFGSANGREEMLNLIDAIATNKTEFFRENDHFDFLRKKVVPQVLFGSSKKIDKKIKIWSAACSTGEEVYSIAMSIEEEKLLGLQHFDFFIYGTDISIKTLKIAESGIYRFDSIKDLPSFFKKRYFLKSKNKKNFLVKIKPEIRKKSAFDRLNFMEEHYGLDGKFHIIFCRNVLIYFDKTTQGAIMFKILKYLDKDGFIFVGHSESLQGLDLPLKKIAPSVYIKT